MLEDRLQPGHERRPLASSSWGSAGGSIGAVPGDNLTNDRDCDWWMAAGRVPQCHCQCSQSPESQEWMTRSGRVIQQMGQLQHASTLLEHAAAGAR